MRRSVTKVLTKHFCTLGSTCESACVCFVKQNKSTWSLLPRFNLHFSDAVLHDEVSVWHERRRPQPGNRKACSRREGERLCIHAFACFSSIVLVGGVHISVGHSAVTQILPFTFLLFALTLCRINLGMEWHCNRRSSEWECLKCFRSLHCVPADPSVFPLSSWWLSSGNRKDEGDGCPAGMGWVDPGSWRHFISLSHPFNLLRVHSEPVVLQPAHHLWATCMDRMSWWNTLKCAHSGSIVPRCARCRSNTLQAWLSWKAALRTASAFEDSWSQIFPPVPTFPCWIFIEFSGASQSSWKFWLPT